MIDAGQAVGALGRVRLFTGLGEHELESIARSMRLRRFRRGEVVFHAGDPGDALFIVTVGEIKIGLPSDSGDEAILATVRPGDFFGELALLDGAPRSASATALERS
jgi:CRP/FNR family transcriptional regulator, cyclic AMP receptor protein